MDAKSIKTIFRTDTDAKTMTEILQAIDCALNYLGRSIVEKIEVHLSTIKCQDKNLYNILFFVNEQKDVDFCIAFEEKFSNITNPNEVFRIISLA